MALSEEDKVLIEENLGFTLEDLIKDPSGYGISEEQLNTLSDMLVSLGEGYYETWISTFNGFVSAGERDKVDPANYAGAGGVAQAEQRTFTKRDAAGNVIYDENGEPEVEVVTGTTGGSGATADVALANGFVTSITKTNNGSNYQSAPEVRIKHGAGSGAYAVATVNNAQEVDTITLSSLVTPSAYEYYIKIYKGLF